MTHPYIIAICNFLVALLCHYCCYADEAQSLYANTLRGLAIISTRNSVGSGFILEMDGQCYLVSNEHVIRSGPPISAKLVDGQEILIGALEVAEDRDLVRFQIEEGTYSPLSASTQLPIIGESVYVFGNSDGGGVLTSLSGKILGIGPDLIELDAQFVCGNSGSPIISSSGSVLGVATYATYDPAPNDWLKTALVLPKYDVLVFVSQEPNGSDWILANIIFVLQLLEILQHFATTFTA